MKLIESKTYYNLAKAYAGECQARVRYEFIEYGARNEGYKALAEAIDKIVYNEFNHARMFYTKIQDASDKEIKNIEICGGYPFKEKWNLLDNLRLAAEDGLQILCLQLYQVEGERLAARILQDGLHRPVQYLRRKDFQELRFGACRLQPVLVYPAESLFL